VAKNILIVDDDRSFVEAVALLLQEHGYGVLMAFGGREGLERLRDGHADLAIIDVHMPELDGLELARAATADSTFVPTILISGDDSRAIQELSRIAGARCFLPKPLDPDHLLECIGEAVAAGGSG
jgi:DNA-binding response OmpR family regulator